MFDVTQEFAIKITSGGDKRCRVKFPTDDQWKARARRQRLTKRSLGRGKSEFETQNAPEVDTDLLVAIRVDGDEPSFDPAEAAKVIERLERCEVIECARIGDEYKVVALAFGQETIHVLRIPTQQQVVDYGRAAVKVHDERRVKVFRVSLDPAENLYQALFVSVEGYAGAIVPVNHKSAVISEMLNEIEAAGEDDQDF